MKIVMTGSSGFIGRALKDFFSKRGDEVNCLVRQKSEEKNAFFWDPYKEQMDSGALKDCDVLSNLAGENILGRWSKEKMQSIYDSRIISTRFLVENAKKYSPKIFIQASAIGYYGDRSEEVLTEESLPGKDFLSKVCQDWENAALSLQSLSRLIFARFGIVLSPEGGALKTMLPAFKMGMAGRLGSGKQYMSWIAIEDLLRAVEHVIKNESVKGPVNFVAPNAVTNEQFTKLLGEVLHRPTLLSIPEWGLKKIFGEGAQLFLSSTKAVPRTLLESAFVFLYPNLETTFRKYFQ